MSNNDVFFPSLNRQGSRRAWKSRVKAYSSHGFCGNNALNYQPYIKINVRIFTSAYNRVTAAKNMRRCCCRAFSITRNSVNSVIWKHFNSKQLLPFPRFYAFVQKLITASANIQEIILHEGIMHLNFLYF